MIAVRRPAVNAGAATPTLSFTQWRGREYLRIETERGVFFHDGEKALLRETILATLSRADTLEPDLLIDADMQKSHSMPRLSRAPDSPERDIPGFEPSASRHPDPHISPEIAPEPGGEQPEDDDPSPDW